MHDREYPGNVTMYVSVLTMDFWPTYPLVSANLPVELHQYSSHTELTIQNITTTMTTFNNLQQHINCCDSLNYQINHTTTIPLHTSSLLQQQRYSCRSSTNMLASSTVNPLSSHYYSLSYSNSSQPTTTTTTTTTTLLPSLVPSSTNGCFRFPNDNNNANMNKVNISKKKTLPINVKKWSILQVGLFIEKLMNTIIAKVFCEHEIDGRALLLLKKKHLCRKMKIKLGAALVILDEIKRNKDITPLLKNFLIIQNNPYDDELNPNGIGNCGVAENFLCENELISKLQSIQIWKSNHMYYPYPSGQKSLWQDLCNFFQRIFQLHYDLDQDRMLISSGLTGIISLLAYLIAINKDLRPRETIIVNPNNPIGDIYDEQTIQPILQFAAEKNQHVIIDEICALNFALSGLRVDVLYAGSNELCSSGAAANFIQLPSILVQEITATLLSDQQWIDSYIKLNRSCLTQQYAKVKKTLEDIDSRIYIRPAKAGFFIWVDFRSLLHEVTYEEEVRLFQVIFEHGVYLVSGSFLGCVQSGWFRIIFSVKEE
ncbi:unnamed protein product [Rotaria sp. Silwood1]|nr:unnamed protein product [Rotaria sp. Silwood1]CAF1644560.1 unnamed protein product [Rotaria sp. Silwood1]CAF3787125.1 unnamed protein product [Rotaria sp. Silwood1]CAF3847279.1 unnamed protein product [Rotaria sp. Silwood1]